MKVVLVEVLAINDNESVSATIILEKKKGDTYNRIEAFDVTSGTLEAKRRLLLADDERVVVEGRAQETHRYDPEQKASVAIGNSDVDLKPTQKERAEAAALPPLKTDSKPTIQNTSLGASPSPSSLNSKPIVPSQSGQGAKSTADLKGQK